MWPEVLGTVIRVELCGAMDGLFSCAPKFYLAKPGAAAGEIY